METMTTPPGQRPEQPRELDFYVILSELGIWYVSSEAAVRVGAMLDRGWRCPRWVKFVDVSGSRVWLRASSIESIYECNTLTRSRAREFNYQRRQESREQRHWEDDE
jgi:hypothetical protein